jgi:hypothetical protein
MHILRLAFTYSLLPTYYLLTHACVQAIFRNPHRITAAGAGFGLAGRLVPIPN